MALRRADYVCKKNKVAEYVLLKDASIVWKQAANHVVIVNTKCLRNKKPSHFLSFSYNVFATP